MPRELEKTPEEAAAFAAAREKWERENQLAVEAWFAAEDDRAAQQSKIEAERKSKRVAAEILELTTMVRQLQLQLAESEIAIAPEIKVVADAITEWRQCRSGAEAAARVVMIEAGAAKPNMDRARVSMADYADCIARHKTARAQIMRAIGGGE